MSEDKNWNLDNVKINRIFTPVVAMVSYGVLHLYGSGSKYVPNVPDNAEKIKYALISAFVYYYASRFFQPDLDNTPNRPGKHSFPLSSEAISAFSGLISMIFYIKKKTLQSWIYFVIKPISFIWYIYWEPYAQLLTHRGISHWPIIGTLTRFGYMYLSARILAETILADYLSVETLDNIMRQIMFLDTSNLFFSFVIVAPIYISDLVHESFDFIETVIIKGYDFCPPRLERGILSKALKVIGIKITI